ncbi:hypothetical protein TGAM01_v204711 [Trichoderma gamsii]|uniref:Uncharacterized protein n=1 Tax=Trichoderma gamsii TaxID=398673 RepID=A0A2P4ZPL6_9HYPO|nr:hypothetical protein TGAM01_v204711 [Trichoderma gamsii]PON26235.1 hypothetical protein TGAM01_v204711 [Trichoderma gamsii]
MDREDSVRRGFALEPSTNGQYKITSLSTLRRLQSHLSSPQRIVVLPGQLDEATIEMLTSHGVPHEFVKSHLEGTEYSWRGSRPQDAIAAYFWVVPQFVRCCGQCTTDVFEYTTNSRGRVVLLSVSLWVSKQQLISVLLVQRSVTNCEETEVPADPSLEDELRRKLPHAGLTISIKDYINQLAYERWVEYVAELNIETVSSDLLWRAAEAVEQNLDTARYIAAEGDALYLADERAWEGMLRRLDFRMRCFKA